MQEHGLFPAAASSWEEGFGKRGMEVFAPFLPAGSTILYVESREVRLRGGWAGGAELLPAVLGDGRPAEKPRGRR